MLATRDVPPNSIEDIFLSNPTDCTLRGEGRGLFILGMLPWAGILRGTRTMGCTPLLERL